MVIGGKITRCHPRVGWKIITPKVGWGYLLGRGQQNSTDLPLSPVGSADSAANFTAFSINADKVMIDR